MTILWEAGEPGGEPGAGNILCAKDVVAQAAERYGWNKNTTYTILKSLIEKGAMRREEPNFRCVPLLRLSQVRRTETRGLIDRLFGGSPSAFLSAFFEEEALSDQQIAEIQRIIDKEDES